MPTYVYRCRECGALLERRQSFQDRPLTQCEVCSGELRRVVQPSGIVFRGSGFYTTDYRSSRSGGSGGGDGGGDSGDGKAEGAAAEEGSTPASSGSSPSERSSATTTGGEKSAGDASQPAPTPNA